MSLTPEYRTVVSHTDKLVTGIARNSQDVANKLIANGLVPSTSCGLHWTEQEVGANLVKPVIGRIKENQSNFKVLLRVLRESETLNGLAEQLEDEKQKIESMPKSSALSDSSDAEAPSVPDEKRQLTTPLDSQQRFPLLNTKDLTEPEIKKLKFMLETDSDKQQNNFAILADKTRESLERKNVACKELSVLVRHSTYNRLYSLIKKSKNIRKMFVKLADYWSFFDYDLLKLFIDRYCPELQQDLMSYELHFKDYCRRRLSEVPADAFGSTSDDKPKLCVKIDSHFPSAKVEYVKNLEKRLSALLATELYLKTVEEGCILVTFINLCDIATPLSPYQVERLKEMKIIHMYSDTEVYYSSTTEPVDYSNVKCGTCVKGCETVTLPELSDARVVLEWCDTNSAEKVCQIPIIIKHPDISKRLQNLHYQSLALLMDKGKVPLHYACEHGDMNLVPVLVRNANGPTPRDVAQGECGRMIEDYIQENHKQLRDHYSTILRLADKKYSGYHRITRILVIGNPGAGKSSFIAPHTAGIIPSVHMSSQYGRVPFYDFAGDAEYYSSHAAIFESLASSRKGDNIFIVVVDLREDSATIKTTLHYWFSFIQYQNFSRSSFIVVGGHLDQSVEQSGCLDEFCTAMQPNVHNIKHFMLDCRDPWSSQIEKQILSSVCESQKYELSIEATLLLGLLALEKDFSAVTACPVQTLVSHIKDSGGWLPVEPKPLHQILMELRVLLLLRDCTKETDHVIRNVSKLTNEVNKLLFSKSALSSISAPHWNVGILPEGILDKTLPQYISKECLVHLQYCQQINHSDIGFFPSFAQEDATSQSFLFFPALCSADKGKVSWDESSNNFNHLSTSPLQNLHKMSTVQPLTITFDRDHCPKGLFDGLLHYPITHLGWSPHIHVIFRSFEVGPDKDEVNNQNYSVCNSIRSTITSGIKEAINALNYSTEKTRHSLGLVCNCNKGHKVTEIASQIMIQSNQQDKGYCPLPGPATYWFGAPPIISIASPARHTIISLNDGNDGKLEFSVTSDTTLDFRNQCLSKREGSHCKTHIYSQIIFRKSDAGIFTLTASNTAGEGQTSFQRIPCLETNYLEAEAGSSPTLTFTVTSALSLPEATEHTLKKSDGTKVTRRLKVEKKCTFVEDSGEYIVSYYSEDGEVEEATLELEVIPTQLQLTIGTGVTWWDLEQSIY